MGDIQAIIFVVPVIALILTSILYLYCLHTVTDKKGFTTFVFIAAALAFLLNFTWEVIQIPLYKGSSFTANHIAFCALGSLADVIMVLLLYLGFAFIFRKPFWIQDARWQKVIILILIGAIGAILSEMRHLSLGSWSYDDSMPIIPVVKVGISPVLQFMILPLIIYRISFNYSLLMKRRKEKKFYSHQL